MVSSFLAKLCVVVYIVSQVNGYYLEHTGLNVPDVDMPPDVNLMTVRVLEDEGSCNNILFRRQGTLFSHRQALMSSLAGTWKDEDHDLRYPDNINCTYTIAVGKAWQVQLQFIGGVGLECDKESGSCDCLHVYDGVTTASPLLASVCGKSESQAAIRTTDEFMTLHLLMDKNCKTSYGIQVVWNAMRECDKPDEIEEIQCDGSHCIPITYTCDGIHQCLDGKDEVVCPPAEMICRYLLSLSPRDVFLTLGIIALFLATLLIICCYVYCKRGSGRVGPGYGGGRGGMGGYCY